MQTIRIGSTRFIQVYKNHLSQPLGEGCYMRLYSPLSGVEVLADMTFQELEYVYLLSIDTQQLSQLDTIAELTLISRLEIPLYQDTITLVKPEPTIISM